VGNSEKFGEKIEVQKFENEKKIVFVCGMMGVVPVLRKSNET